MCRTASFRNGVTSSPNHSLFHVPATSTMVKRPRTCIYTRCAHRPVPFRPRTLASHPPAPDSAPRRPRSPPLGPSPDTVRYMGIPPGPLPPLQTSVPGFGIVHILWGGNATMGTVQARKQGCGLHLATRVRVITRYLMGGNRPYETMGCQVGRSPAA